MRSKLQCRVKGMDLDLFCRVKRIPNPNVGLGICDLYLGFRVNCGADPNLGLGLQV